MEHHTCDLPNTQLFRLEDAVIIVCEPEPEPPPSDPPPRTFDEARVRALLKLGPLVERVLRRANVASADVPDLSQNILIDLLTWWPTHERAPIVAIRAYVAVVARRAAYRYHRRNRRRRERTATHDTPAGASHDHHAHHDHPDREEPRDPADPSPEEAALEAEARAELAAEVNLDVLSAATAPACWRAFYGYLVLNVPVETIAEAEHVPAATIYNRLRLARQTLRDSVRRRRARQRPSAGFG